MKFSFNDFEDQKTFETIYNKNTNQMLFENDQSIGNKLIDKKNLNAYQAKSDSKIREKFSINQKFDKKKNSINKVLEEINNDPNNDLKQSNNDSTKDSNIDDSELKNLDTKKAVKNMVLCKSNNEYINIDNTDLKLWPNNNFNNNNSNNNGNINERLDNINTKEVLLKFKKSNSANINATNNVETYLDNGTKNVLKFIHQNNLNNNISNNDKNIYIDNNDENSTQTHIMPNKNEINNNQFNQNAYIYNKNNMNMNMNMQNSLLNNNNNNFNNGLIYGIFKVYSNNS